MKQIGVLIPTYKRPLKLRPFVDNFTKCSTKATLYFIIDPNDLITIKELSKLKREYDFEIIEVVGEYVKAINVGYKQTKEPFLFLGADDIMFSMKWDIKLLNLMDKNPWVNVTGGIDDWTCSRSGVHISHPFIRRSYCEEQGASFNNKGSLYFEGYKHYQCDIEMEQVAWARNCFKLCKEVTIAHNHFVNHKAEKDETYKRSFQVFKDDLKLYTDRSKYFEWWDIQALHSGEAKPSTNRMKKLSVIMPIWNCEDYTIKTLESLLENTLHPFELILLDDNSTEFDGKELLTKLEKMARTKFLIVKTEVSKKQKYCNGQWNRGVELATGDYIAIINSDIEFETKEWDDYLIENIDLGYDLVSPFQSDLVYPGKPYMLPMPPDVCSKMHLRGACFMMSRSYSKKVFPISTRYKHWFGDNIIGRNAESWLFDIRVSIFHWISKSGAKVDQKIFWNMIYQDALNYVEDTGDKQDEIIASCQKRLKSLH